VNAFEPMERDGLAVRAEVKPEPKPTTSVTLIRGSDIRPEPIDWLWRGWLAAGKLHILAGAPGTGKTTIATSLAAIFSRGGIWPDGSKAGRGSVLIWSGEDDPQDTLAPRLIAAGADMGLIYFVGNVFDYDGHRAFDPARDMDALATAAKSAGNVRLLIVDPVVSAVSGDSHKNTETRRALQPLVDFGIEHGCAVLGISHFSKGSAGRDPVERVCGSIAFGALARIVLAAAKMPDRDGEPGGRVFARAKSNIGPDSGGFRYDLAQVPLTQHAGLIASSVLWGEPREGSARELLAEAETEHGEDDADDGLAGDVWLRAYLHDCGSARKTDAIKAGKAAGFSERTIQRARARIGASVKVTGFGKEKYAIWTLEPAPENANPAMRAVHATSLERGTQGTNDANGAEGWTEGEL
jgi:putative DNA primase/helicase